jgi:hypothetical protein
VDFFDKGFQLSAQEIQNNLTWKNFFMAMGIAAAVVVAGIGVGLATGFLGSPTLLTGLFAGGKATVDAIGVAGWMVNAIFGAITVATCAYQANAYVQDNRVKAARLHEQVLDEAKDTALEATVHQLKQEVSGIKSSHTTETPEMPTHGTTSPSQYIHTPERQGALAQEMLLGKS